MAEEFPRKIGLKTASDVECGTGQRRKPDRGREHDGIAVDKVIVDLLHTVPHGTTVVQPAISAVDARGNVICGRYDAIFTGKTGDKCMDQRLCVSVCPWRAVDDERFHKTGISRARRAADRWPSVPRVRIWWSAPDNRPVLRHVQSL